MIDALAHTPRLLLALSWIAGQGERMLDEHPAPDGTRIGLTPDRSPLEATGHYQM